MIEAISELTLGQIATGIAIVLSAIATVVEYSKNIKAAPWSWIAKRIGRAINSEVLAKMDEVRTAQTDTRKILDEHIRVDNERNADQARERILSFNTELIRNMPHTKEEFTDIMVKIDEYEKYCREHKDYKNHRATHAIANIGRVYDERMQKHDFLSY